MKHETAFGWDLNSMVIFGGVSTSLIHPEFHRVEVRTQV